jgi:hypothetical protein
MKGPEHEFDPTPMNAKRCWKCGLEETNSVHDYPAPVSSRSIEEFDSINSVLKRQRTRHAFEVDWKNSGGPFDVCKHCGLSRFASVHGPDVNHPAVPDAPMIENATDEEYQRAADSIDLSEEEYPYRDSVSDEQDETRHPTRYEILRAFETGLFRNVHVSESWPKDTIGFFDPARIKRVDDTTFYIDNDNRLWAKSEQGDELITRVPGEPPAGQYGFASNQQNPTGPCSCLAHRTENCSECFSGLRSQEFIATVRVKYNNEAAGEFDDSIRHLIEGLYDYRGVTHVDAEVNKVIPSPNPSFAYGDVGPSDLPTVSSVPKAYIATPPAVTQSRASVNITVSEGEHELNQDCYMLGCGCLFDNDGPSDEGFDVVGQMTVDEMLASIADITETIYPNQSASLLPKFELVIRALYENAGDTVNIG